MEPTSTKNRCQIDLGRLWALETVSGTRSGRVWDAKRRPRDRSWGVRGGPRASGNQPKVSTGGSWDAPVRFRSGPQAHVVHRALLSTLAERFCVVFVVSCKSSKLKIRAPTQCFVGLGQCTHRPCASVEKPRKSSRFGSQNRAQERRGDPKLSAGEPDRAKMRAPSASRASENLKVSANEAIASEKARPVPPKCARTPEHAEGFYRNLRMDFQHLPYFSES